MKYIIMDNCGRFYRADIDDWTVAREAATEFSFNALPTFISYPSGVFLEGEITGQDEMTYYANGDLDAVAWTKEVK